MREEAKKRRFICLLLVVLMIAGSFLIARPNEVQAATKYYIKVNRTTNVVTIYDSSTDEPVKAMICSCGGSNTPTGTYYTPAKYRWHELMGPSYGQYCTRITSGVLFHSVWYYQNGNKASQSTVQFNRLGTTASHGCVRLTVADAKWIYDNCALGTKVIIFAGSSSDDPLGKPSMVKVSTSSYMGWDPTDPDSANPYAKYKPKLNVSNVKKVIAYGSTWKPLKGITATSSTGSAISKKSITYKGKVNTNKLGKYKVKYTVTDAIGRVRTKSVTFTVKDLSKPIIDGVDDSVTKEYNSTYKLLSGVTAKSVAGVSLTSRIVVYIKAPGESDFKKYTDSTIKLNQTGKYVVKYTVENPSNKKTKTVKLKIKVQDTKAPVITVPSDTADAVTGETVNLVKGVSANLVSGKSVKKKMIVTVRNSETGDRVELSYSEAKKYIFETSGEYEVSYTAINSKSEASKTVAVTYTVAEAETAGQETGDETQNGSEEQSATGDEAQSGSEEQSTNGDETQSGSDEQTTTGDETQSGNDEQSATGDETQSEDETQSGSDDQENTGDQ